MRAATPSLPSPSSGHKDNFIFKSLPEKCRTACGLVVRVPGWKRRGPGFDSRRYKIFPASEELLVRKIAAPVYKTETNDRRGSAALTTQHPSIRKSWH
jgi:hypothetical protein